MKKLTITTENKLTATNETVQAKSEANMWNILRGIRNTLTAEAIQAGVRSVVTDEEGITFKDITFKMNKAGKIEMPNAVKETCRRHVEKAKAAAKAEAEKIAIKKAKKAAVDRRYREKKKAQKLAAAAAKVAVETPAEN